MTRGVATPVLKGWVPFTPRACSVGARKVQRNRAHSGYVARTFYGSRLVGFVIIIDFKSQTYQMCDVRANIRVASFFSLTSKLFCNEIHTVRAMHSTVMYREGSSVHLIK
jgi:hypothetical protein